MTKKERNEKNVMNQNITANKLDSLESRIDLFNEWIIKEWFKTDIELNFLRRVFNELFMSIYDDLTEKFENKKRDQLFTNFINVVFPTVLDVYKWHESEKVKKDIGLIKALEKIALCDWYIELLTSYSRQYDHR